MRQGELTDALCYYRVKMQVLKTTVPCKIEQSLLGLIPIDRDELD